MFVSFQNRGRKDYVGGGYFKSACNANVIARHRQKPQGGFAPPTQVAILDTRESCDKKILSKSVKLFLTLTVFVSFKRRGQKEGEVGVAPT